MKYLERLNQSKEQKETANNGLLNDEASIEIQTKILKVKQAQAENKALVNKLESSTNKLDYDAMYEADVEGKVLAKRLEWLEAKQTELF